jgi:polysaccharide pyruvyl transferase WcaK-like protein
MSSTPKKKKVLIMTATGSYNLGDEVILSEELKFLQSHYGDMAEFCYFTHDPKWSFVKDPTVKVASYFPNGFFRNPFANIGYFFKNIWLIYRADILIIGGGGLIFDNEPGVNFDMLLWQWYFRTKIARIGWTAIVYLGLSLEVKNSKNKMKLPKIFKRWDFIILRDEKSVGIMEALEIPCSQIPDLAFLYEPQKPEMLPPKKRVGISVRGWFLWDTEKMIPEIYDYLVEKWYDPVFLIHTAAGDESQNDALFIKRVMTGKTYNVTATIEQSLKVYPTLYAVVGMRFHSWVFACIHDIPFLMISYGPKTDELIKLLEFDEFVIRPEALNMERFHELWEHLETHYEERKNHMVQKHQTIKKELITKLQTL